LGDRKTKQRGTQTSTSNRDSKKKKKNSDMSALGKKEKRKKVGGRSEAGLNKCVSKRMTSEVGAHTKRGVKFIFIHEESWTGHEK